MSILEIAWLAVVAVTVAVVLWLWRGRVERTRNLNRWGADFGVSRWEGEDNDDYQDRIRRRIDITGGGKRNPW